MANEIKVLVVDDEDDFRQLLQFWLQSKGYSVIAASNGKAAIDMIKKESPDIVFLDLHMPVLDGTETLKQIREFNKELPIIVISAYLEDPRAIASMSYGVAGVFPKTDNFEKSSVLLESVLRRHKRLDES